MNEPVKKLYRVEVVHVVYVLAEDRRDAEILGERSIEDNGPEEVSAILIEAPEELDQEWRHSIPYGGAHDSATTCLEFLMDAPGGKPAPKPEDPDQQKLFG